MQVMKITSPGQGASTTAGNFTQEQLQQEFNYILAEKITTKLLGAGLITEEEFGQIMAENRRTFPTFLAAIL